MKPQSAPTTTAARKPLRKNSYSNGTNKDMSSNRSNVQAVQAAFGRCELIERLERFERCHLSVRCVGPLADHNHAVVVEDDHFTAVGFLENGGVEHLLRTSFGNQPAIEADDPRQMRRYPVEIVGGNHDGYALVVDLMEKMDHVVARTNIEASRGLIEQEQLRSS